MESYYGVGTCISSVTDKIGKKQKNKECKKDKKEVQPATKQIHWKLDKEISSKACISTGVSKSKVTVKKEH